LKVDHHREILDCIEIISGRPTQHTFLNGYLGNDHPRYAISSPALRALARDWMREHKDLSPAAFGKLLTQLAKGKSGTEKFAVGILMDYSTPEQRKFDPALFDKWLDHLVGWAEVDVVCTGKYTHTEILAQWAAWKQLINKFSRDANINKRRAALVLFCAPLRKHDDPRLAAHALKVIDRLKGEKSILITKAISWVLRSMEKLHRRALEAYIQEQGWTLPAIALRETLVKLETGVKNKRK
jgi:3-methyladenine DNA glycosylase AlkD